MESRIDKFRDFVNKHPLLRDEIRSGKATWQNIYEEWYLYGENSNNWDKYTTTKETKSETKESNGINLDSIKNIVSYVQKLNPDTVNKTLNSVQKVIQIVQTVGGNKSAVAPAVTSMYSDWWD